MTRHTTPEDRALFAYAIRARATYADRMMSDRRPVLAFATVPHILRHGVNVPKVIA